MSEEKPALTPAQTRAFQKAERLRLAREAKLEKQKEGIRVLLGRELNYAKKSYKRGAKKWEAICRQVKHEQLKLELEALWQYVNRSLDRKENTINRYLEGLDTAEEQYRRQFTKHINIIDMAIDVYKTYHKLAKQRYDQEAIESIELALGVMDYLPKIQEDWKDYFNNLLHNTNLLSINHLQEMGEAFNTNKDMIAFEQIITRYNLRDATVDKMENLFNDIQIMSKEFCAAEAELTRNVNYEELVEQDAEFVKNKHKVEVDMEKYSIELVDLQKKLMELELSNNEKLSSQQTKLSYLNQCYWALTRNRTKIQKNQKANLGFLAGESLKCTKLLREKVKYGELLISLAHACTKLQTEEEKVTPFKYSYDPNFKISIAGHDDLESITIMTQFWQRAADAKSHVIALKDEKEKLEKNNNYLRELFKSQAIDYVKIKNTKN